MVSDRCCGTDRDTCCNTLCEHRTKVAEKGLYHKQDDGKGFYAAIDSSSDDNNSLGWYVNRSYNDHMDISVCSDRLQVHTKVGPVYFSIDFSPEQVVELRDFLTDHIVQQKTGLRRL